MKTIEHPLQHMRDHFKAVRTESHRSLEIQYCKHIAAKMSKEEVLDQFTEAERHVLAGHWFCDIGQFKPSKRCYTPMDYEELFRPYYRHEGRRVLTLTPDFG